MNDKDSETPAGAAEEANLDPLETFRHRFLEAADQVIYRWERLRAESATDSPAERASRALVSWRTAALMVAIERLARITLQRGIWP